MTKVIKRGHADWSDLKGKTIRFLFYAEWEDDPWMIQMVFDRTEPYSEDPRYPRYYVWDECGGGYGFWETDSVEVEIID